MQPNDMDSIAVSHNAPNRQENVKKKPMDLFMKTFMLIVNLPWTVPLAEIYFASQVLVAVFLSHLFEREFFKRHFTRDSARTIMIG